MTIINQLIQECKDLLQDQTVSNKKILELALINYKHIIHEDSEQIPDDYFEQIAYAVKELEE